jgi:DNA-binding response OmpR family regulator
LNILIVHGTRETGDFWARALERDGAVVTVTTTFQEARKHLSFNGCDAMILDLALEGEQALELSDYAAVWRPDLPILGLISSRQHAYGQPFALMPNVRHLISMPARMGDLKAIVHSYGGKTIPTLRAKVG